VVERAVELDVSRISRDVTAAWSVNCLSSWVYGPGDVAKSRFGAALQRRTNVHAKRTAPPRRLSPTPSLSRAHICTSRILEGRSGGQVGLSQRMADIASYFVFEKRPPPGAENLRNRRNSFTEDFCSESSARGLLLTCLLSSQVALPRLTCAIAATPAHLHSRCAADH